MRLRSLAITIAAFAAAGALAASPAMAARRISACFTYNGVRYTGLSTNIEYQTANGSWRFLQGSSGHLLSNGCVTYNVTGRYRRWHLRIRASALVSAWRAAFDGTTPYYGPSGAGVYNLGVGRLQLLVLPPAAPSATTPGGDFAVNTQEWLDQMTGGPTAANCSANASPAMQVACYMDAHGLVGNVVVIPRDTDGDGVYDDLDRYPGDPFRS
jgi:hypothetical protein